MLTACSARPAFWSIGDGGPKPRAVMSSVRAPRLRRRALRAARPAEAVGVGYSRRRSTVPGRLTTPARILVPPRSTPMTRFPSKRAATYFLDGDGREALPRLPWWTREGQGAARPAAEGAGPQRTSREPREPKIRRPRRRWSWKRRIGIGLIVVLVVATVWGIAGYLSLQERGRQGERAPRPVGDAGARAAERRCCCRSRRRCCCSAGTTETPTQRRRAEPFRLDQ